MVLGPATPPSRVVARCGTPCYEYRLGDIVHGYMRRDLRKTHSEADAKSFVCRTWPDSMGCAYVRGSARNSMRDRMCRIARAFVMKKNWTMAPPDTTLVHLRLGDVLNWPFYYRLCKTYNCQYVKPLSFYRRVPFPDNTSRILMVSNPYYRSHAGIRNDSSLVYRERVCAVFRQRGYACAFDAPRTADEDFARLAFSYSAITGGGNFASLIQHCRDRANASKQLVRHVL